jgi:hypothetical protein
VAERSVSPPPTTREIVSGSAKQGAGADNSQMSAEGRRSNPSPAMVTKQPEEAQAEDEATAEAGIVDIASPDRDCCPVDLVSFAELPSSGVGYQSCMTD